MIEQLRNEKGGTAGSFSPIRVFLDGDKKIFSILIDECLVEDTSDK